MTAEQLNLPGQRALFTESSGNREAARRHFLAAAHTAAGERADGLFGTNVNVARI